MSIDDFFGIIVSEACDPASVDGHISMMDFTGKYVDELPAL